MKTQLKLFLYIFFVIALFYILQTKYNIFDISFEKLGKEEKIEEEEKRETIDRVLITNGDGNEIVISVEIADDDISRAQGLSKRESLGDYQGMLFTMENEGKHFFWMKDMYISLDIIYISESGEIVEIFEKEQPCSKDYCPTISSILPALYILEVNSGFCEENRVEVGNTVSFGISSEG
ncbi:DUF192 domain-containing protein [Candidatus Dojkabacteria bacterium]|uniref:DUF192 domain-containing protein n=1 Tax=Candidatus Dojkabacteria bacterium TaxID=2099670 RepID=A0A847VCQ8_9BACT|nr:DUF192 domain-containing protein [Candidatus Dojkabacteria bacterium]